MDSESTASSLVFIVECTLFLDRAEMVIKDVIADITSLVGTCFLFEAEMDAAVDPGIINVLADLFPAGVVEDYTRQPGAGQCDGEIVLPEDSLDYGARGSRQSRVS